MHDTIAFSESQDEAGAEANVAGVDDQHIHVSGDDIVVSQNNNIIGAFACAGSTASRVRLISPSLRRLNTYNIDPVILALLPGSFTGFMTHPGNPIQLDINESLNAAITADPAAAEQQSVVVFVAPGAVNPVQGKITPVRYSVTVTLVAGAWAFAQINLVDDLPTGTYTVVGASLVVAAGVAFRFVPVGASHRPGAPCKNTVANFTPREFRFGGLGAWFDFPTVQLPGIEVLADEAATSATYFGTMDVIVK